MASATATAKSERRQSGKAEVKTAADRLSRRRWLPGSRLGRLIIALNLVGLVILIVGALLLNEFRQGLIQARTDSLRTQGELIVRAIAISGAVRGDPRAGDGLQDEAGRPSARSVPAPRPSGCACSKGTASWCSIPI